MNSFGKGYALVVGIANYAHVSKLPLTILKDAEDVSLLLKDPAYCGYPENQVKHLIDAQATASGIRSGIQWLSERTDENDTAVFFFSGHGGRIEGGPLVGNYLIPFDTDPQDLKSTAIDSAELTALLRSIKAGRLLVLFDCCHAGGIGQAKEATPVVLPALKSGLDELLYERLAQGHGRAIIASSRSDEYSWILPEMNNSLFTHYLLQALRGTTPTRGDGLIRLFDVFDYVSQQVSMRYPKQHPLLKAELENNFPIALQRGGLKKDHLLEDSAAGNPEIQNYHSFPLTLVEQNVLARMFAGYERLVVKAEFGGGFGGGRVLMVRPIRQQGAELPAVVKVGRAAIIQKEWHAFDRFVSQKVPNVAQIEGHAVYSGDSAWGGIRYPLAGDGHFYTESLGTFCRHATVDDVVYVLEQRLFPSLGALWQDNHVAREYHFGRAFDPVLPVNFLLRYKARVNDALTLSPQTVRSQPCRPGTKVVLSDFVVSEVNKATGELTLDLPTATDGLPDAYRIRATGVTNIGDYQEGQSLAHPLAGVVESTRHTILQAQVNQIFGTELPITAESINLPGMGTLPNPLHRLPHILNQSEDVRIGPIHGDLNLENILVEYDQKSRNIHLIDFASARKDYVLHDLLRLETSFWLYLVPEELVRHGRSLADLHSLILALYESVSSTGRSSGVPGLEKPFLILAAVRRAAQHLLVNPHSWTQYYEGLTIYLLGALKFKNLDKVQTAPLPKQVAFVTAGIIQQQLQDGPVYSHTPSTFATTNAAIIDSENPLPGALAGQPLSAQTVSLAELMRQIRVLLQECEPFESQRQLRAFFAHPQLKVWRNRLPEEHRLSARVDGTVALLHKRRSQGTGTNALVLLLRILGQDPNIDEDLQPELTELADQLELALGNNE